MPSPGETIPNSVGYHFFDGFPRLAASQSDYFSSETVRGLARLVRLSLHHPSAAMIIVAGQGTASLIQPEGDSGRSDEHTSELQSLMRISYAVFCLKKKKTTNTYNNQLQS